MRCCGLSCMPSPEVGKNLRAGRAWKPAGDAISTILDSYDRPFENAGARVGVEILPEMSSDRTPGLAKIWREVDAAVRRCGYVGRLRFSVRAAALSVPPL